MPFTSENEKLGLPPFRPRLPWLGPDLQTLRNFMVRAPAPLDGERLWLPLNDGSGDRLAGLLHRRPADAAPRPLMVLLHGLNGSEASRYMVIMARHLAEQNCDVLRLNMRGAGPSRPHCGDYYHAGQTGDLHDALDALPPTLMDNGVALIGFSLGGNLALKLAAERRDDDRLRAVVSVSAPIDLALTSRNMLRRRNRVYHWKLLADFRREVLAPGARLSTMERRVIAGARNFLDFDERFVAPRHGFAGAQDYYSRCAARPRLREIRVPSLLIHAQDDPIVPAAPYLDYPWRRQPNLVPLLPRHGGHVGFHGSDRLPWYATAIAGFLDRFAAP
ncbi:MAG TPA: alpha/beta fold hydrolase [Alphaproteobacteria bacterium]|jgi:predicted alpha/beta-fold hydrolase|nr:alpha/beta fold hydrolase [Alphaproteobacteria bacterium]